MQIKKVYTLTHTRRSKDNENGHHTRTHTPTHTDTRVSAVKQSPKLKHKQGIFSGFIADSALSVSLYFY